MHYAPLYMLHIYTPLLVNQLLLFLHFVFFLILYKCSVFDYEYSVLSSFFLLFSPSFAPPPPPPPHPPFMLKCTIVLFYFVSPPPPQPTFIFCDLNVSVSVCLKKNV